MLKEIRLCASFARKLATVGSLRLTRRGTSLISSMQTGASRPLARIWRRYPCWTFMLPGPTCRRECLSLAVAQRIVSLPSCAGSRRPTALTTQSHTMLLSSVASGIARRRRRRLRNAEKQEHQAILNLCEGCSWHYLSHSAFTKCIFRTKHHLSATLVTQYCGFLLSLQMKHEAKGIKPEARADKVPKHMPHVGIT